jgi:hypothetical protein
MDVPDAIYFRAVIEKIKLTGQTEPGRLNTITSKLAQSNCAEDLELVLSLAFLQRRYDRQAFEKTVQMWPQIEDFLGTLILSDLSNRIAQGQLSKQALQQISVFEAELAAEAAWKSKTEDYKILLYHLSSMEKFQTPLILYAAAVALAELSPDKSVHFLIKTSNLQSTLSGQRSDRLDIEGYKIASQAAKLAYNLFAEDSSGCQLALSAFDNYCEMAGEKIDEELEYLYTIVLNGCGQATKSKQLLKKIANRPSGNWRNKARLDLIVQVIQQKQHENQDQRNELLKQLSDLIRDSGGQNEGHSQLRREAITIYCQLLLESQDKQSAQKVLNILGEAETASDPNLNFFKSKALRRLGRLDESADCLLSAIDHDNHQYAIEAMALLSEVINKIDLLEQQANDFSKLAKNCQRIAQYCKRIALSTYGLIPVREARLYLTEISIFAADKDKEKLLEVEKALNDLAKNSSINDVDLVRCRARLLAEQGKFEQAASLWADICKIRKDELLQASQPPPATSGGQRSWKWWRAKFYELACWAKCPQTQKESIAHTIEILENSFTNIPPLWAEKLKLLKQRCRSQPR